MWRHLKSVTSLNAWVMMTFIVVWNAGFLLAIYAGGGRLDALLSPEGQTLAGLTCLAAAVFALAIAAVRPFRELLVDPARAHNFTAKEFYFIAFVTAGLGSTLILGSPTTLAPGP
jgi:hypothetical protein